MLASSACSPPIGADRPEELHRRLVLVQDLAARVEAVIAMLPGPSAADAWWGPAREAVQGTLDRERARLMREVLRLNGVADQLRMAASLAREAALVSGASAVIP